MNILIIGDSWAVPNFYGPPGDDPETHISWLLDEAGYSVFNTGQNGSSNFGALNRAEDFAEGKEVTGLILKHADSKRHRFPITDPKYCPQDTLKRPDSCKIDCIIWFCTSLLRDHESGTPLDIQIAHIMHKTYQKLHELRKKLDWPKLIAIGGAGPIDEYNLKQYGDLHYCIPSWQAELLGIDIAEYEHVSGALNKSHKFESDNLEKFISDAEVVVDAMNHSDLFPDSAHPGKIAHRALFDRLIPVLESIKNDK